MMSRPVGRSRHAGTSGPVVGLVVVAALLLGACSDTLKVTPTVRLDHADLDPSTWLDTLTILDTITLSVQLLDEAGDTVMGPVVNYESLQPEILRVVPSDTGVRVAALSEGEASIIAYVDDPRFDVDTVRHTVVVKGLDVTWPAAINVTNADTARVHLSPRYAGGPLTWRSSNESVLLVRSADTSSVALDTVAAIETLGTGSANLVVVVAAVSLATREITLPVRVKHKWSSVDAGLNHTCALSVSGVAYCWGGNLYGQLGDGSFSSRLRPTQVATPLKFDEVAAGGWPGGISPPQAHSCGRLGQQVFCWGSFQSDQLGDGSGPCSDAFAPTNCLSPLPREATIRGRSLSVGGRHTCTFRDGDPPGTYCWGGKDGGTEWMASGGGGSITGHGGGEHTCFTAFSSVYSGTHCAGRNDAGQLGDGTTTDQLSGTTGGAVLAPGGGQLADNEGAASGWKHSCIVDRSQGPRALLCWGSNSDGQLGPAGPGPASNPCPAGACSRTPVAVPVSVDIANGTLTLGGGHSCFLGTDSVAYCWGRNVEGQLGDGTNESRPTPLPAAGGMHFTSISAGHMHTCGVDLEGSLYCWGANEAGQLGDGTTTNSAVPVRVIEPLGG